MEFTQTELEYLRLLSESYGNIQEASTEIINLAAILNLPKGTEHFISDIHGEYYTLGKRVGSFGCSVRKRRPGRTSPKAPAGGRKKGPGNSRNRP